MAALAVLQAGTFATGAELTAIVFSIFGDGSARFNFANASGMSTKFFSHDRFLLSAKEAVIVPVL